MSVSSKSPQEIVLSPELKEMYAYIDEHKDDAQSFKFDLDDIWHYLGYTFRHNAVRALKKLSKNVHFVCLSNNSGGDPPQKKAKRGGHNRKVYMLSALGLKKLFLNCGTVAALKYRDYLIEAERVYARNKHLIPESETIRAEDAKQKFKSCTMEDYQRTPMGIKESEVRDALASQVGGETEVNLGCVGRVDVVSPNECIEVKHASKWKHALGQVLAYGSTAVMSKKRKRIHLFDTNETDLNIVQNICAKFDVCVTHE